MCNIYSHHHPPRDFTAPDQSGGAYSGSALPARDNSRLNLIFTSDFHAPGRQSEVQNVSYSDARGVKFSDSFTVLVDNPQDVKGTDVNSFRDPKFWWSEEVQLYFQVVGNSVDGVGSVLIYSTANAELRDWQYRGVLYQYADSDMIECPSFVQDFTDSKYWTLIFSIIRKSDHRHVTNYIIGYFDPVKVQFLLQSAVAALDFGPDFYATQAFSDVSAQRNVQISWMQNWDSPQDTFGNGKFAGVMNLAREMRIHASPTYLLSPIAREILPALRRKVLVNDTDPFGSHSFSEITFGPLPELLEIDLLLGFSDLESQSLVTYTIDLQPMNVQIKYLTTRRVLSLQRPGSPEYESPELHLSAKVRLLVLLDRAAVEVFANEGEQCGSLRLTYDGGNNNIRVIVKRTG